MAMLKLVCHQCQTVNEFVDRVGLREECSKCRADLHVCKNCEFYDVKTYNDCRETQAERVQEKDRFNRCDYFQPSGRSGGNQSAQAALLSAAEALFKKS